ncbi:MAG: hypothetical protein DPW23_08105 [Gammaproteobacteria bacterium]|nr:hypothetical protein [Gammaproteobacteria bacterium]
MLQQTQVVTVERYYDRFMAAFPDLQSLAAASEDAVLHAWSGLGYYGRARQLQHAARRVCEAHGGVLPMDLDALMALPGIGRSTAGAILALAGGQRQPIPDGNVERVLLEKRPATGLWGGLWGLPEVEGLDAVGDWCQREIGQPPLRIAQRPVLRHGFTHFDLDMTPVEVDVPEPRRALDGGRWLWYNLHDPARVGLAAPVTRLLNSLLQERPAPP